MRLLPTVSGDVQKQRRLGRSAASKPQMRFIALLLVAINHVSFFVRFPENVHTRSDDVITKTMKTHMIS